MDFDESLFYFFDNDKFKLSFGFVCLMYTLWTYWTLWGGMEFLQYVVNPNLYIIKPLEKIIIVAGGIV
jgi:hypothetical protein